MSGWRIIGAHVKGHAVIYSMGAALLIGSSLLNVWIPRLIGLTTDRLQRGSIGAGDVAVGAGWIIGIGLIRVVAGWLGRTLIHSHGRLLAYKLRRDLFVKWEAMPPGYYHRHSIGDLLSHALSDVEAVRELMTMGLNVSIAGVSLLGAAAFMMAVHMDWRLTVAGLGPLIMIPVIVRIMGPRIKRQSTRSQEALGRMAQTVEEVIGGIRAVKAFGNENVSVGQFAKKIDVIVDEKIKFVRLSALFSALIPLMASLGFVIVMGYGGSLTISGAISLGDLIAFTLYLMMLKMPLEHLGQVFNMGQRAAASLDRLAALLNVVPAVQDRAGVLCDRPVRGHIRADNLTFRYPGTDRDVLTDISFDLQQGRTLGIIGSMGSGKTTLANLLLRLYDPAPGMLFIDDEDILRYPLLRLRQGIAYVPQDGFLFSASVLNNIGFSDVQPDLGRAELAARVASVDENVRHFPEGYRTEIGEQGVRLSGGQKQRVAIARMIYKDAPLQILDDSLSAVDTKTERIIVKNLQDMAAGLNRKTTIVIAHRLSAVRHADEILMLEEGRIVERGTHEALVEARELYARLWQKQSGDITVPAPSLSAMTGTQENILIVEQEVEAAQSAGVEEEP